MNMNLLNKYILLVKPYYDEPHRFYHNWNHIIEMTDHCLSRKLIVSDEQLITILAHDLVYIPGNTTNEELSADLIITLQQQSGECDFDGPTVRKLILSTKNHLSTIYSDQLIIDLDLMRFTCGPEQYKIHSRNIRKEYAIYSDHVYARGRIGFLRDFLKSRKNNIFVSELFSVEQKAAALSNIENEIESMEKIL